MSIEERIKELNIELPKPKEPVGAYVASKLVGNLLFISGQLSIDEKGVLIKGRLGENLTTEEGYNAAKRCALSIISHAKSACKNADLIILHTEWDEFKSLDFRKIVKNKKFILYDLRNLYNLDEIKKKKIRYFSIGR